MAEPERERKACTKYSAETRPSFSKLNEDYIVGRSCYTNSNLIPDTDTRDVEWKKSICPNCCAALTKQTRRHKALLKKPNNKRKKPDVEAEKEEEEEEEDEDEKSEHTIAALRRELEAAMACKVEHMAEITTLIQLKDALKADRARANEELKLMEQRYENMERRTKDEDKKSEHTIAALRRELEAAMACKVEHMAEITTLIQLKDALKADRARANEELKLMEQRYENMERRTEDAANSLFASLQACSQGDLCMSLVARDPRRGCIPNLVNSFRTALPLNKDSRVLTLEHPNFFLWFSIPVSTHAHKHARARQRTNTEAHTHIHTHTHTHSLDPEASVLSSEDTTRRNTAQRKGRKWRSRYSTKSHRLSRPICFWSSTCQSSYTLRMNTGRSIGESCYQSLPSARL